jgi:hypothetical protein
LNYHSLVHSLLHAFKEIFRKKLNWHWNRKKLRKILQESKGLRVPKVLMGFLSSSLAVRVAAVKNPNPNLHSKVYKELETMRRVRMKMRNLYLPRKS